MRRTRPNSIHRLGRRSRLLTWLPSIVWILAFVGLSAAVLAFTSY